MTLNKKQISKIESLKKNGYVPIENHLGNAFLMKNGKITVAIRASGAAVAI